MMSIKSILARGNSLLVTRDESSSTLSPGLIGGIIALMVLIFLALALVITLYFVRKIRRSRAIARQSLPTYNESGSRRNDRRLTITTSPYGGRASSIYVYDEKSSLTTNTSSPPMSPDNVPEIRITFPDEQDESGHRKSGRVVVVRVGEKSIGLEPVKDEELPAYEKGGNERFHSIDMDRIGGLKEKSSWS